MYFYLLLFILDKIFHLSLSVVFGQYGISVTEHRLENNRLIDPYIDFFNLLILFFSLI